MNVFQTISSTFSPPVGWDWAESYVNQLKSKEGEERRKARKQRARELTRMRELEIKKGAIDDQSI